MKMFKKISLFLLLSFIPILTYAGNYTFEPPVSGWQPYEGDTYDTFEEEDVKHPCATRNGGKNNNRCKQEGQDSSGSILRDCGYNGMCSNYFSPHHTGIDYDYNSHDHPDYNSKDGKLKGGYLAIHDGRVDDIVAVNEGKVVLVTKNTDWDRGLGNSIIIEHLCNDTDLCPSGKIYSLYGHLDTIKVKLNDVVSKGEVLGHIGGTADGKKNRWITHLHFEFKTKPVLDAPKCNGVGYTKTNPTDCGYRNPTDYFGKIDVIPSSSSSSKSSYFDGAGSLIKPDGDCYGCQHDAADMQPHSIPSTVVFQWKSGATCIGLKIGVQGINIEGHWIAGDEPLDVVIHTKAWYKDKSTAFKATLPLTVESEHLWNITAVTSQKKVSEMTTIIAECENYMSIEGNRSSINEDMVDLSGNYFWAGNGSVITRALDDKTVGKTQDWAITFDSNKAITAFQWDASENCSSLQLESGDRGEDGEVPVIQVDMKGWNTKNWPDKHLCQGKLPCTIDAPSSDYYILKIKTKGGAIPSGKIHAFCK